MVHKHLYLLFVCIQCDTHAPYIPSTEKARSEELQIQLLDSESNVEMLQMETSTLSQKVEGLEEECEERSHQANTWYQALQVRRKGRGEKRGVTRLIHCTGHYRLGGRGREEGLLYNCIKELQI